MTPLQEIFQQVREERNVLLALPVLFKSNLYVVVAETEPNKFDFFYTKSPQPERLCVTVAESEEALSSIDWPKKAISGSRLLTVLDQAFEIVIMYPDGGGDYITREHLELYRSQFV